MHGARVAAEQERQRQRTEHKRVAEQDSESSHTFLSSHLQIQAPPRFSWVPGFDFQSEPINGFWFQAITKN